MEYVVTIKPRPIVEFESVEDLQRWLERQQAENERAECAGKYPVKFDEKTMAILRQPRKETKSCNA